MSQDHVKTTNEHLKHNSSSDTEEDVRRRKRLAELEKEHQANTSNEQRSATANERK